MSGLLTGALGGALPQTHECSRAGCGAMAVWAIHWRNPKIHAAGRRKTWLACEEHLEYLREFLGARSFPLEVQPMDELLEANDEAASDAASREESGNRE